MNQSRHLFLTAGLFFKWIFVVSYLKYRITKLNNGGRRYNYPHSIYSQLSSHNERCMHAIVSLAQTKWQRSSLLQVKYIQYIQVLYFTTYQKYISFIVLQKHDFQHLCASSAHTCHALALLLFAAFIAYCLPTPVKWHPVHHDCNISDHIY